MLRLIHQQKSNSEPERSIFLICVFRDENLLLEYFIEYYRALGVTHFIMVDNLSEDEGPEYLRSLTNINLRLYRADESYREAAYGTKWVNDLLQRHCIDQYCFTVDVDELFMFDKRRYITLLDLIGDMEKSGENAVPATLLDMYPAKMNDSYQRGSRFLDHSSFFDDLNEEYYEERGAVYESFAFKVGGVRKRVLGVSACINKFPFFKYNFYPLGLAPGYHFFQQGGNVILQSDDIKLHIRPAVLLHFKFIKPQFHEFVEQRIARNEDWDDSVEYRAYQEALSAGKAELQLYDEGFSKRLLSLESLRQFF